VPITLVSVRGYGYGWCCLGRLTEQTGMFFKPRDPSFEFVRFKHAGTLRRGGQ
jgi:hypothetical protein